MLPAGEVRIYLACGVTDMRKGFHSLAAQVQTTLNHDPYSGALYIFRGRRGDLIKILFWDRQGMCLYAKKRKRRGAGLIDGCDQARLARYAANLLRWPVSNDRQFHGSRS
jgi:transposase